MPVGLKPLPRLTSSQFLGFRYRIDDESHPEGCWEWCGAIGFGGYGQFSLRNTGTFRVHRMAYKLATGIDPVGFQVAHTCDNRRCCNPKHLFKVTPEENMQDMISKGRKVVKHGESHKLHKLTEREVLEIRKRPASYSKMAKQFGVSIGLICHIVLRRTWKHI